MSYDSKRVKFVNIDTTPSSGNLLERNGMITPNSSGTIIDYGIDRINPHPSSTEIANKDDYVCIQLDYETCLLVWCKVNLDRIDNLLDTMGDSTPFNFTMSDLLLERLSEDITAVCNMTKLEYNMIAYERVLASEFNTISFIGTSAMSRDDKLDYIMMTNTLACPFYSAETSQPIDFIKDVLTESHKLLRDMTEQFRQLYTYMYSYLRTRDMDAISFTRRTILALKHNLKTLEIYEVMLKHTYIVFNIDSDTEFKALLNIINSVKIDIQEILREIDENEPCRIKCVRSSISISRILSSNFDVISGGVLDEQSGPGDSQLCSQGSEQGGGQSGSQTVNTPGGSTGEQPKTIDVYILKSVYNPELSIVDNIDHHKWLNFDIMCDQIWCEWFED